MQQYEDPSTAGLRSGFDCDQGVLHSSDAAQQMNRPHRLCAIPQRLRHVIATGISCELIWRNNQVL
jgi:hypothetical protein